jgi:hypothetical protein
MREFQLLAEQFSSRMKSALGIDDPLTGQKMLRNPKNKSRLYVKKADNVRSVDAAA